MSSLDERRVLRDVNASVEVAGNASQVLQLTSAEEQGLSWSSGFVEKAGKDLSHFEIRRRWTKYRSCRRDSCPIRQRTVASIATDALYQYRHHPLIRLSEQQHILHLAARLAASLPELTAVLPSSLYRYPQET
jgi:hypothetical protein